MRIAYFDCFSGISGDMTVGALIDAGAGLGALKRELAKLRVPGYAITTSRVLRTGITGTRFICTLSGRRHAHEHRSLGDILRIIERSTLAKTVKERAAKIFWAIGRAEAKIHGVRRITDVRFHEVGAIDSIVDIVGTAVALDLLDIDEVRASQITMGRAFVRTGHGMLPVPAPATFELLKGVPVRVTDAITTELVTPTGAGILSALAAGFGEMPLMEIGRIGYGAGSREGDTVPNMLRVVVGTAGDGYRTDRVSVIEAHIDDMPPQFFDHVFAMLFKEGALDVAVAPIQMKKSRPAFRLTVIAPVQSVSRITACIFRETTTIGVRHYEAGRYILDRRVIRVKTRYGMIPVKVSTGPGGISTVSPEYDVCAAAARRARVPLRLVHEEARQAGAVRLNGGRA